MIIEAGYDLHELLYPRLIRDHERHGGEGTPLWVVALDDELRYLYTRPAVARFRGPLSDHGAEIASCLHDHEGLWNIRYYALAYYRKTGPNDQCHWLHHDELALSDCTELEPFELLGQMVFDEDGYYSTVPRYSFRDYPGHRHLPRAAVIPGPHGLDCRCLACEQHADDMVELRSLDDDARVGLPVGDVEPGDGLDPSDG